MKTWHESWAEMSQVRRSPFYAEFRILFVMEEVSATKVHDCLRSKDGPARQQQRVVWLGRKSAAPVLHRLNTVTSWRGLEMNCDENDRRAWRGSRRLQN